MRKEVLYSMLAALPAAAVPGMAFADTAAQTVNNQQWTGGEYNTANAVYVSNSGDPITISLGTKVPGSYTVNVKGISVREGDVKVEVAGESKTISRNLNELQDVSIDFTLSTETDVTVKVTSVENKAFSVGGDTELTLHYDFKEANDLITAELSKASNTIKNYKLAEFDHSVWNREEAALHSILDNYFKNDISESYSNAYVKYKLWETVDLENNVVKNDNQLLIDLKAAWKQSAQLYKDAVTQLYQAKLDSLKADPAYTSADETVKGKVADQIKAVETALKNLSDIDLNGDLTDNYSVFDNDAKAIDDAIATYSTALTKAKADVTANQDAYNRVNAAADAAKGTYLTELGKSLQDETEAHLLAAGNKAIASLFEQLTAVKNKNQASFDKETAAADEAARNTEINNIKTSLQNTLTDYSVTLKQKLAGFEEQYNTVSKYPEQLKEQYTDSIVQTHADLLKKLTDAIQAVRKTIDDAQTGANADCQKLKTLDLAPAIQAVETAKENLETPSALDKARVDAEKAAAADIVDLNTLLQEAKDSVATLKYADASANAYDWSTSSRIQSSINNLNTQVKNAKNNKYAAAHSFYTQTLPTQKESIKTRISDYETAFTEASGNYNTVDSAVNAANAAIKAANDLVKGLEIYSDTTQNAGFYNYSREYAKALKTITDAQTAEKNAKNRNHAVNRNKYDNTEAVKALSFDPATVQAFVDHVTANYKSDSIAWQGAADAAALQAQKDAIEKKWNDLKDALAAANSDYTDNRLAADKEDLKKSLDELNTAITNDGIEEKVGAAIAAEADASDFGNVKEKLEYYTDIMDSLQVKIDASKAAKTANENALTAVNQAVGDLSWDGGSAIKAAAGEAYTNGENDETARIDALVQAIQNNINAVNTAKTTNYNAYALAAHQKALTDSIKSIKGDIDAATESAKSLKSNWNNYQALVAQHNGIAAVLTQASADAIADDPTVGESYYKNELIDSLYQKEADDILETIKNNYKADKYATDGSQVQNANSSSISALISKIQGLKTSGAVAKNLKDYSDTTTPDFTSVKEKEAEVEDSWNTRMNELATKDQSSQLADRQKKMNEYLEQLTKQEEADKKHYEAGLYGQYGKDGSEATTNTTEQDDRDALQSILNSINSLVNEAVDPENYSKDIASDNLNMLKKIQDERDNAQNAYTVAVKYVDTFKGLTSSQMQTILAQPDVKEAYDAINNQVNPYATTIRDKYTEAETKYNNTVSPVIFDRDSSYVNTFRDVTEEINGYNDAFVAAVKNALETKVKPDLTAWKDSADNALRTANATYRWAKGSRTNYKNIFKTLQDNINAGLTIIEKESVQSTDFTELDNILNQLNGGKFAETLYADVDSAAKSDVLGKLTDAEATVKAANTDPTKISDGTLDAFNTTDAPKIEQARVLYDAGKLYDGDNASYEQIKSLVTEFTADNAYKTFNANNAAYKAAVNNLAARQSQLDEALKSASSYASIETLKTQNGGFNAIQAEIVQLQAEAEAANSASPRNKSKLDSIATLAASYISSGRVTYNKVGTEIADLVSQTGNLYNKEKAYVDERMKEVVAEYNVWAADTTVADSTLAAQKAAIEDLQTKIANVDNGSVRPARTAANLLALEGTISDVLDKLANLNGDLVNTTHAALEASRQAVAAKVSYGDADPDVQKDEAIAADFEALTKDVESKKEEIEKSSLFDKDRISAEIAALDKRADQLAKDIKAKDDEIKADKAAKEAAKTKLELYIAGLKADVEASKKDLDDTFSYTDAKPDKFTNKYNQVSDDITAEENRISEYLAEGNDPRNYTESIESGVKKDLAEIKNLAAYRQLQNDLGTKNPGSYYAEAKAIADSLNKSLFVQSDYEVIKSKWAEIEGSYDEILSKINSEWQSGVSYDDGDDTNGINYVDREAEINVLKAKVDDLKAFYDKNVTTTDFNRDGVVDIYDVTEIINAQLNNESRFDTNGDGIVDIYDVTRVINSQTKVSK